MSSFVSVDLLIYIYTHTHIECLNKRLASLIMETSLLASHLVIAKPVCHV